MGTGNAALLEDLEHPLIDTGSEKDIFASGLAHVEIVGPCARFTLYSDQNLSGGRRERVVVAKIIIPLDAVSPAIRMTLFALSEHVILMARDVWAN